MCIEKGSNEKKRNGPEREKNVMMVSNNVNDD